MKRLHPHVALDDPKQPPPEEDSPQEGSPREDLPRESEPPQSRSLPRPKPFPYCPVEDVTDRANLAESKLGYTFTKKPLLLEALMMSPRGGNVSYLGHRYFVPGNQNLAWVGDRMLEAVLCDLWYKIMRAEGTTLEGIRQNYVTNKALAIRVSEVGLDKCGVVIANLSVCKSQDWYFATILEALVGAVHFDAGGGGVGFEAVKRVAVQLGFYDEGMNDIVKDARAIELHREGRWIREMKDFRKELWQKGGRGRSRSPDDEEDFLSDCDTDRKRYRDRDYDHNDNTLAPIGDMDEFGRDRRLRTSETKP